MSPVEPGRHYRGGEGSLGRATSWNCPTCGSAQSGPLEAGCVTCGAGTPEEAARAAAATAAAKVNPELLRQMTVGAADLHTAALAAPLTGRARLTLARALAHYAEYGAPTTQELTRAQCLAWGRYIAQALDEGEQTNG